MSIQVSSRLYLQQPIWMWTRTTPSKRPPFKKTIQPQMGSVKGGGLTELIVKRER